MREKIPEVEDSSWDGALSRLPGQESGSLQGLWEGTAKYTKHGVVQCGD